MHGCSALTKKKTKIRQYTCVKTPAGASNRGCSPIKYVSADDVEEIVWSQVCEWLNNPELLMAELKDDKQIKELESDLKRYNDLIANVEKGRANMVSALASGLLDLDANTKKTMQDLKLREKNLKERKKELERSLNKNTATVAQIKNIHHRLKDFLSSLDHLQFEQKKLLVREIMRQVVVSGRGKDMRVTIHTAFREAALQQSATRQQMPII